MGVLLLVWAIYIGVGYYLGARRNRVTEGILLGTFLGPIGWGITYFLSPRPLDQPVPHALPSGPARPALPASPGAPPIPPQNGEMHFNVARDGKDLGPMTVRRIRQLLAAGQLEKTDSYFDPQLNAWVTLDLLPE